MQVPPVAAGGRLSAHLPHPHLRGRPELGVDLRELSTDAGGVSLAQRARTIYLHGIIHCVRARRLRGRTGGRAFCVAGRPAFVRVYVYVCMCFCVCVCVYVCVMTPPVRVCDAATPARGCSYQTGILMAHPMYYEWPTQPGAYAGAVLNSSTASLQHMFGPSFTVSPIVAPVAAGTHTIEWPMWCPPGGWVDWYNGGVLAGPAGYVRTYGLAEVPLLARAWAIVPQKTMSDSAAPAPATLVLTLVVAIGAPAPAPGPAPVLYEDDGASLGYTRGEYSMLSAGVALNGTTGATVSVVPATGGSGYAGRPAVRSYLIRARNAPADAGGVVCSGCGGAWEWFWEMDGAVRVLAVATGPMNSAAPFAVSFSF